MPLNEPLLIDTHVWIWLVTADARIKRSKSLPAILQSSKSGTLYLSAISIWEVAMLESKKRLALSLDIEQWVTLALGAPGLSLVSLSPAISIESCRLPDGFHGDPADCIIVSTARHMNYTLVTADAAILDFSNQGHCKAIKA
jgi:PIN domain nuclease of toxin-antitoxin system